MGIFAWIILGLFAGIVAKLLHPGPDPGGFIVTILLGIGGAFIGGLIGSAVFKHGISGFNVWSFLLAVGGSFLLLVLWRWAVAGRAHRRLV